METILEQLFDSFGETSPERLCPGEEQRLRARQGNLRKMLPREQYRQVQRIVTDAEIETLKMSIANFACGVRFGVKFMTEIYKEGCGSLND